MNGTLTTDEENLLKDIIRAIGERPALGEEVRQAYVKETGKPMSFARMDFHLETIWNKLQNGRITIKTQ